MSVDEVAKAIRSFPNGSAGGPDGLRPQHLKDLTGPSSEGGGHALLSALVSFLSLVLSGGTPLSIRPYFFGANLFALEKKDGGGGGLSLLAAVSAALLRRWPQARC